jgi:hypothetical protein
VGFIGYSKNGSHPTALSFAEHPYKKAPQVGFEPTTDRLTADCSAIELLRITSLFNFQIERTLSFVWTILSKNTTVTIRLPVDFAQTGLNPPVGLCLLGLFKVPRSGL